MSTAGWEKIRYLFWSLLTIVVTAGFIAVMFINLQDLERIQIQEYQGLADKLGQSAIDLILENHYDNFLDMMRLMTRAPNIDYMALYIDGAILMQVRKPGLNPRVVKPSFQGQRNWVFTGGREHYLVVDITLPYHPDLMQGHSALRIVFSLRVFMEHKNNILLASGMILLLVLALMASFYLLAKADENKSMAVQDAAHTALKVLGRIILRVDNLLQTLKVEKRMSKYFRDLKLCAEDSNALKRFLKNLNAHEKLNHNNVWLHCTNIDLGAKLEKIPQQFEITLAKEGKRIQLNLPSEPAMIWTAEHALEDILVNMIDNAVKYTDVQSVVAVSLQSNDGHYEILICDHGPGVDQCNREKIFRPYQRLLKEKDGSGLGLSNARSLARLLGGEVGIKETNPGEGSTFFISLPKNHGN